MPSSTKTPLKGGRKKVTASARARISTRKIRKSVNNSAHGSYLEEPEQVGVSNNSATNHGSSVPLGQDLTTTIIAMLQKLSESNQSLMQRVEKIEQKNSNECVTINQPSQLSEHLPISRYPD